MGTKMTPFAPTFKWICFPIVASKSSNYNLFSVNIRGILFYDIVGISMCISIQGFVRKARIFEFTFGGRLLIKKKD